MLRTRSRRKVLLVLLLLLPALRPAHAQAPLTGDLALWTDPQHRALNPTTACDDAGVCAVFWFIQDDPENARFDLLGAVVSRSGISAPITLRKEIEGLPGAPLAVGLQEGFAVFHDRATPGNATTLLYLFAEDLSAALPPIPLSLAARGAVGYGGTSSVVRIPEGFALLGESWPPRGAGYVSLAFVDREGKPLRPPVQLDSLPNGNIGLQLAVQPQGTLVVVYSQIGRNSCSKVYVRRVVSSGRFLGHFVGPTVAVADRSCFQDWPAVSAAADGSFVVAWGSAGVKTPGVTLAERFSASARPVGKPFRLSQAQAASSPVAAASVNGHYFLAWNGYRPSDLRGRWLDPDGTPITPELTLNEVEDDLAWFPPRIAASRGFTVVTWQASTPGNVYARLFTAPP